MKKYTLTSTGYLVSTLEEASEVSPAVGSTKEHPARSDRYSFLSTTKLIKRLQKIGWEITHVKQSGKSTFARHIIRMTTPALKALDLRSDEIIPQIIIDNSHDGLTQANIHMGIFRVCSRMGLVIQVPGLSSSFKFKHIGLEGKDIEDLMSRVAEQYNLITPRIIQMMNLQLTEEQKKEFVINALAAREPWRFQRPSANGQKEILRDKIEKLNDLGMIMTPLRLEDEGNSLWRVFNVIQERLIEGGYKRTSDKGRVSQTRPISIPSRNIDFNKTLWEMADSYLGQYQA